MTKNTTPSPRWLTPPRIVLAVIVILMLAGGTLVRSKRIGADPLDVSHSSQLLFLLTARSYQAAAQNDSSQAVTSFDYVQATQDAPVLQWIDAKVADLLRADLIAVARWSSIIGWMLAGLLVYLILRKIAHPLAVTAVLAMMIFLPFSIQFSRVVLPGSWAMLFAILSLWQLWRWVERSKWRTAIISGLLGSISILLQSEWLFILLGGLIAAWLISQKKQNWALPQALFMAALFIAPRLAYTLWVHPDTFLTSFLGLTGVLFSLSSLKQLVRLELRMESIIGVLGIGFVLFGVFLTQKGVRRSLLLGLWSGFAVMSLISLKAISESIYLLYPLVLLSSLSFITLFEMLLDSMSKNNLRVFNLIFLSAILVLSAGLGSLDGRRLVKANPEQIPVGFWKAAGEKLGSNAVFLSNSNAVTLPLSWYGGVQPACFPTSGNCLNQVDQIFERTPDAQIYFVFFKTDLDKVLAGSSSLSLSAYRCDLGSGVVMIPLTANHPACNETGGQQ